MRILASIALIVLSSIGVANAQDYPVRPVTIVLNAAAGGATDILGRLVAQQLSQQLGKQFVVENRVGAGGNIGTAAVAKAPRDGYTLLFTISSSHVVSPLLYAQPGFDPVKDFDPVILVARVPFLLVVHSSVPASSVKELIALAKAQPGKITYGSSGNGSTNHLAGEMFKTMSGVDMLHVPYKGVAAALADMLGGRIHVVFASVPSVRSQLKDGNLRALAITTLKRSALVPELPPVGDTVKGYDVDFWVALFTPSGTAKEISTKLYSALTRALAGADVRERFAAQGADVVGGSPDELATTLRADLAKWAKIVTATGVKID